MQPNGMLTWMRPIGRDQPYTINVSAASRNGESLVTWRVNVERTYKPIMTRIENMGQTNKRKIKGIVNYADKVRL